METEAFDAVRNGARQPLLGFVQGLGVFCFGILSDATLECVMETEASEAVRTGARKPCETLRPKTLKCGEGGSVQAAV